MKEVQEAAYAKINWYLAVGGRRADGYHDIVTLMQTVSLADTVRVTVGEEGEPFRLICTGAYHVSEDRTNLAWVATERFFSRYGGEARGTVTIGKYIPLSGGLAGGSADAAAVLRAYNRIFDNPFSMGELLELAASIGSDVPFCLVGGLARCEGRGERLTALPPLPKRHLLLVNAGEPVSTAAAYAALDDREEIAPLGDGEALLTALRLGGEAVCRTGLRNDFASVVLPQCPRALAALRALEGYGVPTQMSGSGSTIYALFPDEASARAAAQEIGQGAVYAYTV